jgi:hypothetical protein
VDASKCFFRFALTANIVQSGRHLR